MRRLGLALSFTLLGCPTAHDPMVIDEPDSGPDLDSGPIRLLDATIILDAIAADARVCEPAFVGTCSPSPAKEVRCGSLTCSGTTPICCSHNGSDNIAPTCIGIGVRCDQSSDVTHNIVSDCDDSGDCPPSFVCIDGFNNGLNQNDGARCVDVHDAYCGDSPRVGPGITQKMQLCHADCECPRGQTCMVSSAGSGNCGPR